MARKARLASDSGIYHVMLRGVNRQDIFESDKDFLKFLSLMERVAFPVDETGKPTKPLLVFYAYCLMPNHVHLLVKEQKCCRISDAIKSISVSYAYYYNQKYEHLGHLFQDRFRSETVNDMEYFVTLLRYIHQNPVTGGLVNNVRYYRWSSWREFDPGMVCNVPLCATNAVFSKISFDALEELIEESLPKTRRMLDFDNDTSVRMDDDEVRAFIHEACGIETISEIQHYPKAQRNEVLKKLIEYGAGFRQITRVTGISRGVFEKLVENATKGDGSAW